MSESTRSREAAKGDGEIWTCNILKCFHHRADHRWIFPYDCLVDECKCAGEVNDQIENRTHV